VRHVRFRVDVGNYIAMQRCFERVLVLDLGRLPALARKMAQTVACNHDTVMGQRRCIDDDIQGQRILDERGRSNPHC
jgi:hypothetical protein